jgi:hypothetical protein
MMLFVLNIVFETETSTSFCIEIFCNISQLYHLFMYNCYKRIMNIINLQIKLVKMYQPVYFDIPSGSFS